MSTTDTTADLLLDAITQTQAEMGRVDTKASMLLLGSLTSVSVGVAVLAKAHLNRPAIAAGILAVTLIAAAVSLLITAVRPALGGNHGFVRWAAAPTVSALLTNFNPTDRDHAAYQAQRLLSLSRSVYRKYRLVRLATDLLRAALLVVVLAVVLTAVI